MHLLRAPDGRPFAARSAARVRVDVPDAESVRWLPGAAQFLWTSEGDFGRGFGPQMRAAHADGSHARSWTLPPAFQPGPGHGPRGNGTLEGLALAPDGRSAWLAMELPWRQDGPTARHGRPGAPVRSAQGGDGQRHIVVIAHRSTVCVRTSCSIDNRQHVAPCMSTG